MKGTVGRIKRTFQSYSEDKVPRMAAALSYYTIFSIAPLLVLVIAIAGFIIGNNAAIRDQVFTEVRNLVGAQGAQLVNTLITNASRPRNSLIASAIGLIMLIFGATGVFTQLKDALNTIWEVAPNKGRGVSGIFKEQMSGFVMILGLGFLLLVSLVVSTALSVLNQYFSDLLGNAGIISLMINYGIQIIVITFIFGAIFKGIPDVKLEWDDVRMGALVTAVLFLLGQFIISVYFTRASPASAYGAAGSLVVLLLWLYYSAQILFFGAEFTKVSYLSRGNVIVPKENARLLTETDRIHQGIPHVEGREPVRPAAEPERGVLFPNAAVIPVSGEEEDQTEEGELHEEQVSISKRPKPRG